MTQTNDKILKLSFTILVAIIALAVAVFIAPKSVAAAGPLEITGVTDYSQIFKREEKRYNPVNVQVSGDPIRVDLIYWFDGNPTERTMTMRKLGSSGYRGVVPRSHNRDVFYYIKAYGEDGDVVMDPVGGPDAPYEMRAETRKTRIANYKFNKFYGKLLGRRHNLEKTYYSQLIERSPKVQYGETFNRTTRYIFHLTDKQARFVNRALTKTKYTSRSDAITEVARQFLKSIGDSF